jgi:hypothetical protein
MQAALGDLHPCVTELACKGTDGLVVVPAAGAVRAEALGAVAGLIQRGATVLWESGAAFLDPRDFARQRALTFEHFGISLQQPIDVWPRSASRRTSVGAKNKSARDMRAIGHEQIPYVVFHWPTEVHVRDFSRVIPVSAEDGSAIAHWAEIPVAWHKPVGAGTLIFMGSPVGPALNAGDSDAASLLRSFVNV